MRKIFRYLPLLFLTFNSNVIIFILRSYRVKIYTVSRREYDTYSVLISLKGKDAWVLVDASSIWRYCFAYIRVVDIDDSGLICNAVDSRYVERNDIISFADEWDYFVDRTLNSHFRYRLDSLQVYQPLEILTTDELMERLEENCHRRI